MTRRSLRLVPLLAVLLVTLTACSPPIIGTIGISRSDDGSIELLVRICRESTDQLTLQAINSFPHAANGEPQSTTWKSVPDYTVSLTPAVTAASDVAMPIDEQTILPAVLYDFVASGNGGNAFSTHFSADDLTALEVGRVLAPDSGEEDANPTFTPEQFENYAAEFCN